LGVLVVWYQLRDKIRFKIYGTGTVKIPIDLVHEQVQGHLLKFSAQVRKLSKQTLLAVSIAKYRKVDAEVG
jgi:hypothetical protein